MPLIEVLGLLLLGIFAGTMSGLIGIGGGIVIVPILIFVFGLSQKMAQGTTLAILILPIGLLAAITYYKQGYVDFRYAALIVLGFVFGGLLGAKLAIRIPNELLSKIFAVSIITIGIKMLFSK